IEAEVILMAKNNVDGVYSADPKTNKDAVKYETLSFMDMLNEGLEVMDSTASSLCMDNDIRLIVFSITEEGNIKRVVEGEELGTIIRGNKMANDVIKELKVKMKDAIEAYSKNLATVRAGRANPSLLDNVFVMY